MNHERNIEQAARPCVWMDAGVLDYRLCDRHFECDLCPLDQALRGELREADRDDRSRHADSVRGPRFLPPFQFRPDCFYKANHFWLRVERGGAVRIGLDDFGQQLLGRIYSVGLPEVGQRLDEESSVELVNQLGTFHPLLSLRGRVVWRNRELEARPALVNRDPFEGGGFLLIDPDDLKTELSRRRFGDEAVCWLTEEAERLGAELVRLVEESRPGVGPTLPDGGTPTGDLLALIRREEAFRRVAERFLRPEELGGALGKGE